MEPTSVEAAVMATIAERLGRESFVRLVDEILSDVFPV
jgi:hypothetical protein